MKKNYILLIFCSLLFFQKIFAITVQQATTTSVKVVLNGQSVKKDQEFFVVNKAGKKIAIVKITVFNSKQAIGKLVKGKISPEITGSTLVSPRTPASATPASTNASSDGQGENTQQIVTKSLKSKNTWGVLGSYMMNSMNVKFSQGGVNQTADLSGSSFGAFGFYDYALNKDLQIRGYGGIENFVAKQIKETAVCDKGTSTECNVSISYLSVYGLGKYNITKNKNKIWVGGGLGYLLALSKSSSVLDTSFISSNQVLTLAAGVDMGLSRNQIVPISLDYSLFPSSSTVSASFLSLKVGFGFGQ